MLNELRHLAHSALWDNSAPSLWQYCSGFGNSQISKDNNTQLRGFDQLWSQDRGLPYGHLHSGNILCEGNNVYKLSELENFLLGLPSRHRHLHVAHGKIKVNMTDILATCDLIFSVRFACSGKLVSHSSQLNPLRLSYKVTSITLVCYCMRWGLGLS